ncbi:hypothetical protein M1563_02890 [Patescibacteria group bacterium]|nr:hypothetical protein [Patescibacteria group bacterium]
MAVTELSIEREYYQTGKKAFKVEKEDGNYQLVVLLSFRNPRHLNRVVDELTEDRPIAFHGWGVSGVGKRVDEEANSKAFWFYKEGRALGSKIPLLEPPEYLVEHVDWASVHPLYRYLSDPNEMKKLWKDVLPFHVIFPYKQGGKTLSNDVITPAFDPAVAPETPVPTMCAFWIEDPALINMMHKIKQEDPGYQVGVSSLNMSGALPPFNTQELINYLQEHKITHYNLVIEDPIAERFDIASSHSQLLIPLQGEDPVWKMKRRGSLSASGFSKLTGLNSREVTGVKVAARRASDTADLDTQLKQMSLAIRRHHKWHAIEDLKAVLHLA